MGTLKAAAEQTQKRTVEDRVARYEVEIKILEESLKTANSQEATLNIKGKINALYDRMFKESSRLKDYYFMCLDYEIQPYVNSDMVEWYLNQIFYFQDHAYISTMLKYGLNVGDISRRMMDLQEYRQKVDNLLSIEANTYISHASYAHALKRGARILRGGIKDCVLSTGSIVIDLDYRETEFGGMLAEDFYEYMKDLGAFKKYGEPSFCVVSSEGSGMQIVYLLDEEYKTYLKPERVERYERAVKAMIAHYKPYGADPACSDIGHLFRVPCSFNIKTKSWGFLLHWERLKDDEEEVIRYPFEKFEVQRATRPTVQPKPDIELYAGCSSDYALGRCKDLTLLINMRRNNIEGYRNPILFIFASQYGIIYNDEERIYDALLKVNDMFEEPKPEKEISYIAKRAATRCYSYKDETICELLNISSDERRCFQTIGHKKPAQTRWANKADQIMLSRNSQIIAERDSGTPVKTLMQKYGLSKSQVYKILATKGPRA